MTDQSAIENASEVLASEDITDEDIKELVDELVENANSPEELISTISELTDDVAKRQSLMQMVLDKISESPARRTRNPIEVGIARKGTRQVVGEKVFRGSPFGDVLAHCASITSPSEVIEFPVEKGREAAAKARLKRDLKELKLDSVFSALSEPGMVILYKRAVPTSAS